MNKADLTEVLAHRAGIPKTKAGAYINLLTEAIQEALVRGDKVTISDFGTFSVSNRKSFDGRNPRTKAPMKVRAVKIAGFRNGKGLKTALNE